MRRPARAGCSTPTRPRRPASPTHAQDSDMASFNSVAVIGAGSWGTALAGAAARAGRDVTLYARNAETVAQMKSTRINPRLPGVPVDSRIEITADMIAAADADIVLMATPAQHLRET